jgi:hypothetical protein
MAAAGRNLIIDKPSCFGEALLFAGVAAVGGGTYLKKESLLHLNIPFGAPWWGFCGFFEE